MPSSRSITATFRRGWRRASSRAAARPRMPAPTTATSQLSGIDLPGIALTSHAEGDRGEPASSRGGARAGPVPHLARLEGPAAVRVRDVEIALVLAREMKAAADRDVDASLRLGQLREVFGADQLDRAERARLQTALEMAGLAPRPSLLDAELDEPIRFAVGGAASGDVVAPEEAAPQAPPEPPSAPEPPQRQEFPTVGEFARSTFARFRGRRARREPAEAPPAIVAEAAPVFEKPVAHVEEPGPAEDGRGRGPEELEPDEPVAAEPEPEQVEEAAAEEPVAAEAVAEE